MKHRFWKCIFICSFVRFCFFFRLSIYFVRVKRYIISSFSFLFLNNFIMLSFIFRNQTKLICCYKFPLIIILKKKCFHHFFFFTSYLRLYSCFVRYFKYYSFKKCDLHKNETTSMNNEHHWMVARMFASYSGVWNAGDWSQPSHYWQHIFVWTE